MNRRGLPVVISAPSGTGKTTIIREILKQRSDLVFSVSATTRKPRPGEVDGIHYWFISRAEFKHGLDEGRFVEWEEIHDEFYGTEALTFEQTLADGRHVLLDLDVNGGERMKEVHPETVLIFLYPPSLEELRRRLKNRGTETEESLKRRLDRYPMEKEKGKKYPFQIMNDEIARATEEVLRIIDHNSID